MYHIKFIILTISKCTVQWCLVYSHCFATKLQNFLSYETETLYSITTPKFPLLSTPGNQQTPFCFYEFDYTGYPHKSGIMQCLSFCDGLIPLSLMATSFIHAIVYIRISFLLILNNIPF